MRVVELQGGKAEELTPVLVTDIGDAEIEEDSAARRTTPRPRAGSRTPADPRRSTAPPQARPPTAAPGPLRGRAPSACLDEAVQHDWNHLLQTSTRRLAALVAEADPAAPVPGCPDWCAADLVEHVGGVYQWAVSAVLTGQPEADVSPAPADLSALAPWFSGHADELVRVLTGTDPDQAAWTFGRGHGTAGWWTRRAVHETLLHTFDLLDSQGRAEEWQVPAGLAWDALGEVVTLFYPRQVRMGRVDPLPGTLLLSPTDLDTDPVAVGDGRPVVEVSAPAAELVLLAYRRRTSEDPEAAALLAHGLTP